MRSSLSGVWKPALIFFDLLKGKYIIHQISMKDVRAQLIENEQGLNIQFILDAFQSPEKGNLRCSQY